MTRFHLSPQQKRLFLDGSAGNPVQIAISIRREGNFSPALLEQAINRVVARHEALRTFFERPIGIKIPLQVIAETSIIELDTNPAGAETDLARRFDGAAPFELERLPLLRCRLIGDEAASAILAVQAPTVLMDRKSWQIFARELIETYAGLSAGHGRVGAAPDAEDAEDDEPVQYLQFSEWQNAMLAGEDESAAEGLAFWNKRSNCEAPDPALARDPAARPGSIARRIPGACAQRLDAMASMENGGEGTREAILFAAWATLLARLSGRAQCRLGLVSDGRSYEELEGVLGRFEKLLPIDLSVAPGDCFSDLRTRAAQAVEVAIAWQDSYDPCAATGTNADCHERFVFAVRPDPKRSEGGKTSIPPTDWGLDTEPFDLKLSVCGDELTCHYRGGFQTGAVATLMDRFLVLLDRLSARPDSPAGSLELLLPEEVDFLQAFNASPNSQREPELIHHRFEGIAAQRPDAAALVYEDRQLDYATLNRQANWLAHRLIGLGIVPENLVAIALPRSHQTLVAMLAVLKAGAAYLPLDPDLPAQRHEQLIDLAKPKLILVGGAFDAICSKVPILRIEDPELGSGNGPDHNPAVAMDPGNLAYVLFTSGSTGQPKAVMVAHAQLSQYVDGAIRACSLEADHNYAFISTFYADLGNTALFPSLCLGGCLHIVSAERAVDPGALGGYCRQHPIDVLKIVPSHLNALMSDDDAAAAFLPRRRLILGGEACSPETLAKIRDLAPDCRIYNHYGPTETTVGVLVHEVAAGQLPDERGLPLGRPLAHVEIQLCAPFATRVPLGARGEICIGGTGLARGYLGCPDLTAAAFLPAPNGQRHYRSGDVGMFAGAEPNLFFAGRTDDQIKIRGFRIEPGEIETALMSLPGVVAALALKIECDGRPHLAAFGAVRGEHPQERDAVQLLAARLPAQFLPDRILFLDRLPLNANGKIDRKALAKMANDAFRQASGGGNFAAPATPEQEALCAVWREVLGAERVGIHDNYFHLGGDSITSIQIMARAKRHGILLRPKQILEHPTVASCLAAQPPAGVQPVTGTNPAQGVCPLSPTQAWFFGQALATPQHWNMAFLTAPAQVLSTPRLSQAVQAIWSHHDALRLVFPAPGKAVFCDEAKQLDIVYRDLSGLEPDARLGELERYSAAIQSGFHLEKGPLFAVALFDLGDLGQRVLFCAHHLVVDGVSWRILLDDLDTVYRQLEAGLPASLPQKTSGFHAWTEAASRLAATPDDGAESAVWRLTQAPDPLPRDLPGGNLEADGAEFTVSFPQPLTSALLHDLPARIGVRIDESLIAALGEAVSTWTGARAYVTLEGHGRDDLGGQFDLSRTVGWFTCRYPALLPKPDPEDDAVAHLTRMRHMLRETAAESGGYAMRRYLGKAAGSSESAQRPPDPEITFNYLGQIDNSFDENALFQPADESIGPLHAPDGQRTGLLSVRAMVQGGCLRLSLGYSKAIHREKTIADLARRFEAAMKRLVQAGQATTSPAWLPLDFPLANLNEGQLRAVSASLGQFANPSQPLRAVIEDLYPCSPIQHGILFRALLNRAADPYFRQIGWTFSDENLDLDAFQSAWSEALNHHPILRTGFLWQDLEQPHQVVFRQARLPFEMLDWSQRETGDLELALRALTEGERERSFDLKGAPLMRLILIHLGGNAYRIVWSYHHLVMDGWSKYRLLAQIWQRYEASKAGQAYVWLAAPPFSRFIAWLKDRDSAQAAAFWTGYLAGLNRPTSLLQPRARVEPAIPTRFAERESLIENAALDAFLACARAHELTANTVVQGAWSLALADLAGTDEVLYGTTVAGRPAELSGIESMLGPFINSLPVRVRLEPELGLDRWLAQLQRNLSQIREFEYSALTDIKAWSGLDPDRELFQHLVVFYNYPVDMNLRSSRLATSAEDVQLIEDSGYPLNLIAQLKDRLSLAVKYDAARFEPALIDRLTVRLELTIQAFAATPGIRIESIVGQFHEHDRKLMDRAQQRFRENRNRPSPRRRAVPVE